MNLFDWMEDKKQRKQILAHLAGLSQDYKTVFGTPAGKRVLEDLAKRSYDRRTIYDPDEFRRGMNEGRRALFNDIRSMVEHDLQAVQEELTK